MKYTMAVTQQFGAGHFKAGEQVFIRPINGTNNVILSKSKHHPAGPTVSREWLRDLVIAEPTPKQEVVETTTVTGKAVHAFRHVGSVALDATGERVSAYLMDRSPENRYYVRDGERMRGIGICEYTGFKSREE